MTLKFSTVLRNGMLDSIESTISTDPLLVIYTGGSPTLITDPSSGSLLVSMPLPTDWMNAASGGSKTKNGTWQSIAVGTGTAGYFRILSSASTTHMQGSVSGSGLGGDMTLDNTSINASQSVTVATFTLNSGNA